MPLVEKDNGNQDTQGEQYITYEVPALYKPTYFMTQVVNIVLYVMTTYVNSYKHASMQTN